LTPCQLAQLFERLHNPKQCHSQLKVNPWLQASLGKILQQY
jgi:hypothetical protein